MALGKFVVGEAWAELKFDKVGARKSVGDTLDDGTMKKHGERAGKASAGGFGGAFKGALAGMGLAALVSGVVGFAGDAVGEAREAQKVGAQTGAVIKSTGGAAGRSAEQIDRMSGALSKKIGVDDDAIQSSANLLLTFTNIRGEIFDKSIPAIQDMSKALGQDSSSSAIQLGKALNDPIKGITALSRVGVSFTEQQKDQIKSMVEAGDVAGAQTLILEELNKEFGGSAEAQATAADKARVAIDNLKESLGNLLLPVIDKVATFINEKFVPAIDAIIGAFKDPDVTSEGFIGWMERIGSTLRMIFDFIGNNKELLRNLALGILAVAAAWGIWNAVMAISPVTWIILAIGAVVAALIWAYTHFEGFRNVVDAVFQFLKGAVMGWWDIMSHVWTWLREVAWPIAQTVFMAIAGVIGWLWNNVWAPIFGFMWGLVQGMWAWLSQVMWPVAQAVFMGIAGVVSWLWNNVWQPVFNFMWDLVRTVWGWLSGTAWPIAQAVFSGIAGVVSWLWTSVWQPVFNFMWDLVRTVWNWLSGTAWPVAQVIFQGIGAVVMWLWTNVFQPAWGFIWEIMKAVWNWISTVAWPVAKFVFEAIAAVVMWLWTNVFQPAWGFIWEIMKTVWNWLSTVAWPVAKDIFERIGAVVSAVVDTIRAVLKAWWDYMISLWAWVTDTAWPAMRAVWQQLSDHISAIVDAIKQVWADFRAKLEELGTAVATWVTDRITNFTEFKDKIIALWTETFDSARGKWEEFRTMLSEAWSKFWTDMESRVSKFKDAWTTVWGQIRDTVKEPIRALIGFLNDPLIKGYNIVAKYVKLPEIGTIGIPFNKGGMVPGGYGTKDTVPAMLTPGEGVLTTGEIKKLGGRRGFESFRNVLQYYNKGGIVEQLGKAFSDVGNAVAGGGSIAGYGPEQLMNAATIVNVGRSMGVPLQGLLVGLMTAMQESWLLNLGHRGAANDHDSVGLFQQRPSMGWGSAAQIMNPMYSAGKFFSSLMSSGNWLSRGLSAAAQFVQRSAFPSAYAKHEGAARQILDALLGGGLDDGIFGFFTNFVKKFSDGMFGEMPDLKKWGPFGETLTAGGKQLVGGAANTLWEGVQKMMASFTGGMVGGSLGSKGTGVAAIINLVSGLAKQLGVGFRVTSSFRPGDPGYHGSGRAVDFGGFNQDALAGALYAMGGSLLELIHTTPKRGYYIKNGRPISSYGAENERHRDHIHVAMKNGGFVPGYGRGDRVPAMLEAGEYVTPRDQVGQLGNTYHINVTIPASDVREFNNVIEFFERVQQTARAGVN